MSAEAYDFSLLEFWDSWLDPEIEKIISDETIEVVQRLVFQLADEPEAVKTVVDRSNFVPLVREMSKLDTVGNRSLTDAILEAGKLANNDETDKAKEVIKRFLASCRSRFYRNIAKNYLGDSDEPKPTPETTSVILHAKPTGPHDLHILSGPYDPGNMAVALQIRPEQFLRAKDNLAWGPLTAIADRGAWNKIRQAYWEPAYQPWYRDEDEAYDPTNIFNQIYEERDRLRDAPNIFLWVTPNLAERILLCWIVAVFNHLGIGTDKIRFVERDMYVGLKVRNFLGINVEPLPEGESWRPPSETEILALDEAWSALSEPRPERLIRYCAPGSPQPQFLKDALRAFMTRYPWADSGLSYWDKVVLENCRKHGPGAVRITANAMSHDAPYPESPSDVGIFDRLRRLADPGLAHPLVRLSGDVSNVRTTEVFLTSAGEQVLAGEANFIALNGIEDQVGGVRLSSKDNLLWLYDGSQLISGDHLLGR